MTTRSHRGRFRTNTPRLRGNCGKSGAYTHSASISMSSLQKSARDCRYERDTTATRLPLCGSAAIRRTTPSLLFWPRARAKAHHFQPLGGAAYHSLRIERRRQELCTDGRRYPTVTTRPPENARHHVSQLGAERLRGDARQRLRRSDVGGGARSTEAVAVDAAGRDSTSLRRGGARHRARHPRPVRRIFPLASENL